MKMNKVFTDNGWADYVYWETQDRKTLKRINTLIRDIERNGNEGNGKPEPLTGDLAGWYSQMTELCCVAAIILGRKIL